MLKTFSAVLIDKKQLTKDIFVLKFDLNSQEFDFIAGQYVVLIIPKDGNLIKRLYSISSSPQEKGYFELLVEIIAGGVGSEYVKNLVVGSQVDFQGPAGIFVLRETNKNKIFLATGTGIAPIKSMIYSIRNLVQVYLFWGLKTYEDLYNFEDLKKLGQQYPNFKFYICLSREINLDKIKEEDRSFFILGRVNKGLDAFDGQLKSMSDTSEFYICGGPPAVEALNQYLTDKGIKKENIFFERF